MNLPPPVRAQHRDWTAERVWSGIPESSVWRLTRAGEVRFVKVVRSSHFPGPAEERARLEWAGDHLPVPRVLGDGSAGGVDWLVTSALPGADATRVDTAGDPGALVAALGRGLRRFHEAPAAHCPFRFDLEVALAHARRRVEAGLVEADRHLHPEHRHLTPTQAIHRLERSRPDAEDLVVCHGDYCLPNVLIEGGHATGYLDLGELGVADRWWDLAAATWSVTWNLGPGWEEPFLQAYGVSTDPVRTAYYRLLYDLVS